MRSIMKFTGRTILLSLFYISGVIIISALLMMSGVTFPDTGTDQVTSLVQLLFAGLTISLFSVLLHARYPRTARWQLFVIILTILFLSNMSVAIEGRFFTPTLITNKVLVSLLLQQFLIAFFYSITASFFIAGRHSAGIATDDSDESGVNWLLLRIMTGAAVYIIMYYSFGFINYSLFTRPYYDMGISGLMVPEGKILLYILVSRGILISLTVVPFVLLVRPKMKIRWWEPGVILFLFGGLLPLSMTFNLFPIQFTLYSLAEILLQNFLTGIVLYHIFTFKRSQNPGSS